MEGNKNSQQEVVFKLFYSDTKRDFTLQYLKSFRILFFKIRFSSSCQNSVSLVYFWNKKWRPLVVSYPNKIKCTHLHEKIVKHSKWVKDEGQFYDKTSTFSLFNKTAKEGRKEQKHKKKRKNEQNDFFKWKWQRYRARRLPLLPHTLL